MLVRGGGDLASGVVARLHRAGFWVVVTEIAEPLAVRRLVAFAEAVYAGEVQIEEMHGRLVHDLADAIGELGGGSIPVLVDPEAECRHALELVALVDGRMTKRGTELGIGVAPMVVGIGPGFEAGVNCHAVVETHRGHRMGRVHWIGTTQADTGVPDAVAGHAVDRVLRAPASGIFKGCMTLASIVKEGDLLGTVDEVELRAPFSGVLRGLLHGGLRVEKGAKVGDLDPRGDPSVCNEISDKSLAVGGGVLEALLSRPEIRHHLASAAD